ncbi:hypothetical protein Taro_028837 [Colocasia esculenta]|uniref:Uncharacterized protein n=1 Tax=Colocasia esculenta TaxID=4460 RepID=A0A843VVD4_COLES|nr:hypothetical protein [Colocasia esculenta]
MEERNWFSRMRYLYSVTFGTYVLDWWERYIFNALVLMLFWFIGSGVLKTSLLVYDKFLVSYV